DCLDIDDWLTADVLVTDPPYGVAYVSNWAKDGPSDPLEADADTTARDRALDIWGNQRPALVFGSWKAPAPTGSASSSCGTRATRPAWATSRCRGVPRTRRSTCSAPAGMGAVGRTCSGTRPSPRQRRHA